MLTLNKMYLNKIRRYRMLVIRHRNINRFIRNKLNEMTSVKEYEMDHKLEKQDDNYEKIGLNNNLDSLINNIKDDFKDELQEKTDNNAIINTNDDKILVVISCHTDNNLRLKSIELIMHYLKEVKNIDIIIVNSKGLILSSFLKERYKNDYFKYYEIKNDQYYGFSKWYYGLVQNEFMNYKFITFMNDSILIHHPIKHFFDYTRFKNVDLYGYNDSSQIIHHYQSYFFSVKSSAIINFLKLFNEKKNLVKCYADAVHNFELCLFDYFTDRDCFLNLSHFPLNRGKNIFFENDFLYFKLKRYGLLPFTKLKRIKPI